MPSVAALHADGLTEARHGDQVKGFFFFKLLWDFGKLFWLPRPLTQHQTSQGRGGTSASVSKPPATRPAKLAGPASETLMPEPAVVKLCFAVSIFCLRVGGLASWCWGDGLLPTCQTHAEFGMGKARPRSYPTSLGLWATPVDSLTSPPQLCEG